MCVESTVDFIIQFYYVENFQKEREEFFKFTDYLLPVDSIGKLVENLNWRRIPNSTDVFTCVPVYGIVYKVCNLIVVSIKCSFVRLSFNCNFETFTYYSNIVQRSTATFCLFVQMEWAEYEKCKHLIIKPIIEAKDFNFLRVVSILHVHG